MTIDDIKQKLVDRIALEVDRDNVEKIERYTAILNNITHGDINHRMAEKQMENPYGQQQFPEDLDN